MGAMQPVCWSKYTICNSEKRRTKTKQYKKIIWSGRCVLCISTSKRMLAHAFAYSKMIENTRKCENE